MATVFSEKDSFPGLRGLAYSKCSLPLNILDSSRRALRSSIVLPPQEKLVLGPEWEGMWLLLQSRWDQGNEGHRAQRGGFSGARKG